jgi:hypothetical protein
MSVQLPAIEVSKRYVHRINGEDVVVRHAIPKQVSYSRFSPAGQVITIAVANDREVVISCFLTYNLQLLYKKTHRFDFIGQVSKVNIGKDGGVSLLGTFPCQCGGDGPRIFGLIVTSLEVPGAYVDIAAWRRTSTLPTFMSRASAQVVVLVATIYYAVGRFLQRSLRRRSGKGNR